MAADKPLTGRVAWVTGSSRGLGRVMAVKLATLGAKVVVHGTTPTSSRAFGEADSLDSVAKAVAAETGAEVLAVPADLTDAAAVKTAHDAIIARFGRIDILVNNAGGDIGAAGTSGPKGGKPARNDAVFIDLPDLRTVIDRNLTTCLLVCRQVAPGMMDRKQGWIINIGSVAGCAGRVEGAIYGVAKAAVHHYTRSLAAQLRPFNIAVNCVVPGGTMSHRFVVTGQAAPDVAEKVGTLEGYGRPEDTAAAVAFLAGAGGSHISGQLLRVDGGGQLFAS